MKRDTARFKRWMDSATLVIIAGGLGIAIYQSYEIRKSIDAANASTNFSTWNSTAQQWLDMDGMFVEHPETRKYIFEGATAPTEQKELEQSMAVANKVIDFIDNAITIEAYTKDEKQSTGFRNILNQDGWDNYFGEIFSKSPMICDRIRNHELGYFPATVAMARTKCANRW